MKPLTPKLFAPVALLLPLALGYVWPHAEPNGLQGSSSRWQAPTLAESAPIEVNPEGLARFWPLSTPQTEETDNAKSTETRRWRLVAVINQGGQPSATLLSPQGELLNLKPGDMLDEQRRITHIATTVLHWQGGDDQGTLALFPRPQTKAEHEQITNEN